MVLEPFRLLRLFERLTQIGIKGGRLDGNSFLFLPYPPQLLTQACTLYSQCNLISKHHLFIDLALFSHIYYSQYTISLHRRTPCGPLQEPIKARKGPSSYAVRGLLSERAHQP